MTNLRRPQHLDRYLLAAIVLVGMTLRLIYLLRIYPFIDEYNTMLAIKMILAKGIPLMPSGLFYNHGILFSYIGALFAALLGFSQTVARLPSLLISLPTILLLYHAGQRWFSTRVGLGAALLLALCPEAIEWGGRARMYALWQFMTLAAVLLLYEGMILRPSTRARCLGIAALAGAALCHMRALILLPPLGLGLLLAWLLTQHTAPAASRPRRIPWPELVTALGGTLLLLAAQRLDRPGGVADSTVIQTESLLNPVRLIADIIIGAQQFLIPPYLVLTSLAFVGFLALFLRLKRRQPGPADPTLILLYCIVIGTVVEFSLISPLIIRVPRYVFDLLPFYFLIVCHEIDFLFGLVAARLKPRRQPIIRWLPLGLLPILFVGPARSMVTTQRYAASLALDVVREQWQPGDRLATYLTATAGVVLEHCDHFVALENPFLYKNAEGSLTDPFLGLPWIGTESELRQIIEESTRLWLLVEKRYAGAYEQILDDQMDLVFEQWDVNLYLIPGGQ
jgi:4-amino-4-deoxy-L-arabinose transferase-like glycosyltransferase